MTTDSGSNEVVQNPSAAPMGEKPTPAIPPEVRLKEILKQIKKQTAYYGSDEEVRQRIRRIERNLSSIETSVAEYESPPVWVTSAARQPGRGSRLPVARSGDDKFVYYVL